MYCLFEKTENKRKRGRGWHIFLNKDENRPIFVEVCECPFKINPGADVIYKFKAIYAKLKYMWM